MGGSYGIPMVSLWYSCMDVPGFWFGFLVFLVFPWSYVVVVWLVELFGLGDRHCTSLEEKRERVRREKIGR